MKSGNLKGSLRAGLALFGFVFSISLAPGQSTFGTIVGTLKDPAGGVIVNAKVTVTNEGTNIAKETNSSTTGDYEVTHLNPGLYRVEIEAGGFRRHVSQQINLAT